MQWLERAKRLVLDDVRTSIVIACAAAIGGAIALRIFGLRYALGIGPFWTYPVGDALMMLTGWRYYVHEGIGLPLMQTWMTNEPSGANLIYFDAIPIVAMVAKVFVPRGSSWQPYGTWHCAIYVLQAIFGALVARAIGLRSLLGGLALAVIAVTTPVFLLRYYHEGLNGQFVLWWALYAYVSTRESASMHGPAALACALLIHPYLFAMALPIVLAAQMKIVRTAPREAAIGLGACVGGIVVAWFVAGYTFQKPTLGEAMQFGRASMNLRSLFVPFYSFATSWLPADRGEYGGDLQWDGHNFLGVAVFLLIVPAAFGVRHVRALARRHWALLAGVAALACYAPGPRWFYGKKLLFEYHLPHALASLGGTYRATGRFFWPVTYTLVVALAVLVVRRFGARRAAIVLAVAAAAQMLDATAYASFVATVFDHGWDRKLDWDAWEPLLASVDRVTMYPTFTCWTAAAEERTHRVQRELELLAATRGLHTNDGRRARALVSCDKQARERISVEHGMLTSRTLYVLFKPEYNDVVPRRLGEDRCVEVRDGWLCAEGLGPELHAAAAAMSAGDRQPVR